MASSPGILTITLTSETIAGSTNNTNGATIFTGTTIQPQTIIMRGYHVKMDSTASALAQNVIYLQLPFLGSTTLIDGVPTSKRLQLPLDNDAVTNKQEMTSPLTVIQPIPPQFQCACYNRDGSLVDTSKVLYVSVTFSYGSTSVTGY
jgi:hypothetical protein